MNGSKCGQTVFQKHKPEKVLKMCPASQKHVSIRQDKASLRSPHWLEDVWLSSFARDTCTFVALQESSIIFQEISINHCSSWLLVLRCMAATVKHVLDELDELGSL